MSLFLLQGMPPDGYFEFMRRRSGFAAALFSLGLIPLADSFGAGHRQFAWPEVQKLVQAGRLEDAFQAFQSSPENNAAHYFDLGTLAFQLGKLGPSVAYLERASRLSPHDPDIHHNLEVARAELGKK